MLACPVFKKSLKAVTLVLSLSAGTVLANECQIQISQPVLDYGSFNPHLLRATARTADTVSLGKRQLQLNVLCAEPKNLALAFQGIAAGPDAYRIGELGSFDLTFSDARVDGNPVLLGAVANAAEVPAENGVSARLAPGKYLIPTLAQQLVPGKALSVKVEVGARVVTEKLKVRDVAVLDGQGVFELH